MGLLRFMTAGSVDDGKSTLIGRLFHDAGLILDDQMKNISKGGLNLAYFTDGLKEEREKGITIDVAYRYFETPKRKFVVADAPGHKEFTRNMVTAATHSDAVLVLVDATRGVSEQTRRHLFLARWLGVKSVAVLINKMDLVEYKEEVFTAIKNEILKLGENTIIPMSALLSDNIMGLSMNMPWYQGTTLFQWLHDVPGKHGHVKQGVRFPVQLVKGNEILGTIKSGQISVNDTLAVNNSEETVNVSEIFLYPKHYQSAGTGMSIRLKIDRPLKRGDVLSEKASSLNRCANWKVEWCYLLEKTLDVGAKIFLRNETKEVRVTQIVIRENFEMNEQRWNSSEVTEMEMNGIYRGDLKLQEDLCVDVNDKFALIDEVSGNTIAAGIFRSTL